MFKKPFPLILSVILTIILIATVATDAINQVNAQELSDHYFPLFTHYEQPLTSNSYYMITVDSDFLYDLGCELGTRDQLTEGTQDSVAVLDFSYPVCDTEVEYGAELFNYGPVGLSDIQTAVQSFASGYYICTGSDDDSNLVIGVGTNNKATSCDTEQNAVNHAAAWAAMVNSINGWATTQGIFQQVQIYGASDIEVGWNTPSWSRAWVDSYGDVSNYPLIHFGDAAGCPYVEGSTSTTCGAGWTMEDVWYVSWGSGTSLPLPLIYLTNGIHAQQWANLSRYSVSEHGSPMDFTGVFTQSQACEQWSCSGTDNSPYEAYEQMRSELAKYPATKQELDWKTDIRWILSSELDRSAAASETTSDSSKSLFVQEDIELLESYLESTQLSTTMENSLEEKLQLFETIAINIEVSRQHAAPKTPNTTSSQSESTDPEFRTGIQPGGMVAGLPYGVTIINTWQTITDSGYLQVAAGTAENDSSRGALYILQTSFEKTETQTTLVFAPETFGPLTIVEERESGLLVQTEEGAVLMFDLATFTFIAQDS